MHVLAWSLAGYWFSYKIISLASLLIEKHPIHPPFDLISY
jgi:hypothetical protein